MFSLTIDIHQKKKPSIFKTKLDGDIYIYFFYEKAISIKN